MRIEHDDIIKLIHQHLKDNGFEEIGAGAIKIEAWHTAEGIKMFVDIQLPAEKVMKTGPYR